MSELEVNVDERAEDNSSLAEWYRMRARPVLVAAENRDVVWLDRAVGDLAHAGGHEADLHVFVLGESGVGKSSVLNALLSERLHILPQGRVGPATAHATVIRWAAEPYFRARCSGRQALLELRDALDAPPPSSTTFAQALYRGGQASPLPHPQLARLLVQGSQFGLFDPDYLAACLAACIDGRADWPADAPMADRERLEAVLRCMIVGELPDPFIRRLAGEDLPAFLRAVLNHSAGFLAPVTCEIEIGWDAGVLTSGIVLVDLPGLGIANDAFRAETRDRLSLARAMLVVVDRSGLPQSAADLLRKTGFLEWMVDSHMAGATGLLQLVVAVVKLDLSADEAKKSADMNRREPDKTWREHFDKQCSAAMDLVRQQLRRELGVAARTLGVPPEGEAAAVGAVLAQIEIRPVAPVEYQRAHRCDPEEPARLAAHDTHIAGLARALEQMAQRARVDVAGWVERELRATATLQHLRSDIRAEAAHLAHHLSTHLREDVGWTPPRPRRREAEG